MAASFQGALGLYHVALPKVKDRKRGTYHDIKTPTEKTTLGSTYIIKPFCLSKWISTYHKTTCSFVDLGTHIPPSLVVLLTGLKSNSDYARIALVTCPLPSHNTKPGGGSGNQQHSQLAFHVWDTYEWSKRLSHLPSRGLISSMFSKTRGILYNTDTSVHEIQHRTNTRFQTSNGGVGSIPVGLTTSGTNYCADSRNTGSSAAGVLSVYTTFHCERYKSSTPASSSSLPSTSDSSSIGSTPVLLEWTSPPCRRHWLIQTFIGDSKESKYSTNKLSKIANGCVHGEEKKSDEDDSVYGGAQSIVLCELINQPKLQKLYPYRVSRNPFTSRRRKNTGVAVHQDYQHIAVWFRPLYGNSESKYIGMIEKDSAGIFRLVQLIDGRDVLFLPCYQQERNLSSSVEDDGTIINNDKSSSSTETPQALIVSRDGGSVSLWRHQQRSNDKIDAKNLKPPWQQVSGDASCRPILGMNGEKTTSVSSSLENFVEFRQFLLSRFQNRLSLLVIASTSGSHGKYCLIAGQQVDEEDLVWSSLLPNLKEDPILWLEECEQVSLVIPLPNEGSKRGGLGVATTLRVLILSADLNIMAEIDDTPPPGSLVPLGSYTVAYCSHGDNKLRYLSGLPGIGRSGVIASLSAPVPSYCTSWLLGIRPDRFLLLPYHSGTRLVERGQSANSILLPTAVTRPALLLEPMVANAIATADGDEDTAISFLRNVFEKFGRKIATMSHDEGEGIGNYGAGITSTVFELLDYYNLKSAASWLLTGTISFDRSANSRLLPMHLPITAQVKAALDTDTHLHLIANGDQYLTEYVKSPDNNMSCVLPRSSDSVAILCRQFASDKIKDGKFIDAVKMLDIAGTQSDDAMILQLSMALQLNPSNDVSSIIDSLYQHEGRSTPSAIASLAALSSELKKGTIPSAEFNNRWIHSLAPSVQRSRKYGRNRSRMIGEASLSVIGAKSELHRQSFSKEFLESKLAWNEGPDHEKENLLILDHIQDWFGRSRPTILGKDGASRADDRGASTLAGILQSHDDDDSFGGDNDDSFEDGWVDGVGEGLKGNPNLLLLVLYFRNIL